MRYWTVLISPNRYEAERVYHEDLLDLGGLDDALAPGDRVAVVAGVDPPVAYALGEVRAAGDSAYYADDPDSGAGGGHVVIAYTSRFLDAPQPVESPAAVVT